MKQLIFSAICIAYLFNASAQQDVKAGRHINDQVSGNLLYIYEYTDIQGSPFLFDEWTDGVILINQAQLNHVKLKFDTYSNKFVVNKNHTAYEISKSINEVRLYPNNDTFNTRIYRKGFNINMRVNPNVFMQVMAEGKLTLLKYTYKDLEEYNEYGSAIKYKRFRDGQQFFILKDGQYTSTTLTKKNLQDALNDKWAAVSDFLSKKGLNGKDEKSWIAAFRFYNSLN
jgi:hypothetical protein